MLPRLMPAPVSATLLGTPFRFDVPPGLFSADRVDDGTRLLLEHLPERPPGRVLDLGCGWGALGLPVAAAFPEARCLLVDRDLLAVEASRHNAVARGLANVEARGSLGYRDVGDEAFDWVLCNVPARIGDEAIAYILGAGAARLNEGGELRVVVITDLGPVVERVCGARGWRVRRIVDGARHVVFALGRVPWASADHEELYRRDTVRVGDLVLERPHDINDDPSHHREGLALLLDCLPKSGTSAIVWRGGYGAATTQLRRRGIEVTAADRDLLALAYTVRNAGLVTTIGAAALASIETDRKAPLLVGELVANVGDEALARDLAVSRTLLAPKGQALWLGHARTLKDLKPALDALKATTIATRGRWSVIRIGA